MVALFDHASRRLRSLLAPPFRPDPERDVLLASYPRSGNSWMRAVIATLQLRRPIGTLRELDYIVPDIHYPVPRRKVQKLPFQVVKSHSPLTQLAPEAAFRRVIYVVRDPRDVARSYYRFQTRLKRQSNDFNDFIRQMAVGQIWPCSWQEHVSGWLIGAAMCPTTSVLFVRYEDFLDDPITNVARLDSFLGLNSPPDIVSMAANSTSLMEMKKKEIAANRRTIEVGEPHFIGSGSSQNLLRQENFSPLDLLNELAGSVMRRFGYDPSHSI